MVRLGTIARWVGAALFAAAVIAGGPASAHNGSHDDRPAAGVERASDPAAEIETETTGADEPAGPELASTEDGNPRGSGRCAGDGCCELGAACCAGALATPAAALVRPHAGAAAFARSEAELSPAPPGSPRRPPRFPS